MEYTKDAAEFAAAIAEAKTSGRLFGTEHHLMLGDRVVYLTDAEVADANARTAAEANDPERLRLTGLDAAIKADAQIATLKAMSNAEFDAWWDANVTTAAQVIAVLKRLCRVMIRRVL